MISACPPWPDWAAGICSLQCDAHASVGMSHARSSALSYPAFGKALRAQKGCQNDTEAREWRLHPQVLITSTDGCSIWYLPEFPAWAWIKGTQLCRAIVDNGNCKLPAVSNTWTGLSPHGPRDLGLLSERENPGRWAGVCRGALALAWSQWLCVTGEGGGGDPAGHCTMATLPCTSAVGAGPGSPVQVPIPQDAQMLLVTAVGILEEKCCRWLCEGSGSSEPQHGGALVVSFCWCK